MPTIEVFPGDVRRASAQIPADAPVTMLNLLRYRDQANYGTGSDGDSLSGRQAYFERYIPAWSKAVAPFGGAAPVWLGSTNAHLVGPPGECWDDIALIEYPSFAVFTAMLASDDYKTNADPHRRAALADWRLIASHPITLD